MNRHTPDISNPRESEHRGTPIELTGADLERVAGGIVVGLPPLRPQRSDDNTSPLPW
jgi:hypothetical protein